MKIVKAINNNVVSAKDENGREIVIMGKGIGFKVKEDDIVSEDSIEKIFFMDNQSSIDKFKELLKNLPMEHFNVSNDIISYAKVNLNKKLNQNIYITLTDHISFAVERFQQGMMFHNPLLWEVQSIYPQEYSIGQYAINLIKKELCIAFPIDEAASIALHLVNAEYDTAMSEAMNITKMIPAIVNVVKSYYDVEIDEKSLHYERFVTHLKFLAQRIVKQELLNNQDNDLSEMITNKYPKEFECSKTIGKYIAEKFEYVITDEEMAYLTIHIRRVIVS